MGRKLRPRGPKKKGGLLIGMRSGVQRAAKKVGGKSAAEGGPTTPRAKLLSSLWNVLTVLLVLAAGAVMLRRCGVIRF